MRITSENPEETFASLEKYGRDLTALARAGKLDPVIGRDDERRSHPGALATNEEQPGTHWRAGRGKDGDRRGPRASNHGR